MGGVSIPWTQIVIGWLVVSVLVCALFSVWYDRCGWHDSEPGAHFDGEPWVPEGWQE